MPTNLKNKGYRTEKKKKGSARRKKMRPLVILYAEIQSMARMEEEDKRNSTLLNTWYDRIMA